MGATPTDAVFSVEETAGLDSEVGAASGEVAPSPEGSEIYDAGIAEPPLRSPRRVWATIAVVLIVGMILVGILFFGLLGSKYAFLSPPSPSSAPQSLTFSEAYQLVNASAQQHTGVRGCSSPPKG